MSNRMAASGASPRPQPRPIQLTYASFEARVAAATLDLLVLFIIGALLITAGALVILISSDFEKTDPSTLSINTFWACVGAIAPASLLYLFLSYAWKGQTVGKAVMQLMMVRSDGRPLGVFGAIARVIGVLTYFLLFGLGAIGAFILRGSTLPAAIAMGAAMAFIVIGVLIAAFDGRRRMLHDRIAGTIVVKLQG